MAFILGGLPLLVLIGLGYQRAEYGNLWPFSLPERINYCGERYYRALEITPGTAHYVTEAQGLADADRTSLVFAHDVGLLRSWPVYRTNDFQCPQSDDEQHDQYVFIQVGPDRYVEMTDAD